MSDSIQRLAAPRRRSKARKTLLSVLRCWQVYVMLLPALIELTKDSFETHEYLNYLKDTGAQHFKERYDAYRAKYTLE